jgi:hypothetical protein
MVKKGEEFLFLLKKELRRPIRDKDSSLQENKEKIFMLSFFRCLSGDPCNLIKKIIIIYCLRNFIF